VAIITGRVFSPPASVAAWENSIYEINQGRYYWSGFIGPAHVEAARRLVLWK
jgi:hypothetical protein